MKPILRYNKAYSCVFVLIVLTTIFNFGCGRSPRETARFAKAGTTYTTALDLLLVRAGDLSMDANSEFIISRDSISNVTVDQYMGLTSADREKLKVINRLRAHTKLLARYFELLYELSTSNASNQAATAIEGTVKNINELGNEIRGSSLISDAARTAISNVTKLVVTTKIRRSLNNELEARNEVIRKELVTQEELLKFLSSDIEHNLNIANMTREKRLVIDPLIAPQPIKPADIDQWKGHRKAALTARATVDDLTSASKAVTKLREAYESLLNGKLDITRVNDALEDFEIIISTAESLKNLTGEEK